MKTTQYKYKDKIYFVKDFGTSLKGSACTKIKNQEKQMILGSGSSTFICSEKFFEQNFKTV